MKEYNYHVCRDCFDVLEFGYIEWDISPEIEQHVEECASILSERHGGRLYYEQDKDEEFSAKPCECCGSYLAGSRYVYTGITD